MAMTARQPSERRARKAPRIGDAAVFGITTTLRY
jgi:hypothetical protein